MDQIIAIEQFLSANPGILMLMALWSLAWTGWALWRAGRRSQKKWFVAMLILNTLGILEILYIFLFSKKQEESLNPVEKPKQEN